MMVSGWFEGECGAVLFTVEGGSEVDCARKLVSLHGDDCKGVDGEVEAPFGFNEPKFWGLVDELPVRECNG